MSGTENGSHRRKQGSTPDAGNPGREHVPGLAARKAAAKLLAAVIDARTPLDGLTDHEHGHPQYRALDIRDRGLVRAILTTALRFRVTIGKLIDLRLQNRLPANATALAHILNVAAAQILFLDVPDSAAVDLAVEHAKSDPRTRRFSGLVNGVLRALARAKQSELGPALETTVDAPAWFAERLTSAYGAERTGRILAAHRVEAPIDFTVKSDAAGWAARLGGVVLPTGSVRVAKLPGNVDELPGFAEGQWWVQDAAAALPTQLFGDIAGRSVADLCAAPGGKTAQLLLAGGQVTAVDASRNRLARLARNLERLGMRAETMEADLFAFPPAAQFDAVLLDAPCSSTGTARRHPDVPWTKSPSDVAKLADLQLRMLEAAARLVRPGGRLVFSNCSLDPLEGEILLSRFLTEQGDLVLEPIGPAETPGIAAFLTAEGTLRTTPGDLDLGSPALSGLDGFFAARLRRQGH